MGWVSRRWIAESEEEERSGDTSHVKAICKMNGLSDGNLIYIGQKLLLP